VKAEQDRAIRVEDLPEVVMGGTRLRLAKERLVPFEAASHIAYPNDRPGALHLGVLLRPNDQAQRPPPETPGRLQQSLTNYPNRRTAQRGGGSLQRFC
jgi:hypothetical protein